MLDTSNQKHIGDLLAKMNHQSLNLQKLQYTILTELANMCDVKGPCSIVRILALNSQTTRIIGKPFHISLNYKEKAFLPIWTKCLKQGGFPIAHSIFQQSEKNTYEVNFAKSPELLKQAKQDSNTPAENSFFRNLRKTEFSELGYLWLNFTSGFTWIICLRRRKDEGVFTKQQQVLLEQFAHAAVGNKYSWYIPSFDKLDATNKKLKNTLTQRQFETLHYIGHFYSRKECAKLMGVSRTTIDRNVENILSTFRDNLNEFDSKNILQIIRELKQ